MVGRRTCDQQVAGSIPSQASLHSNLAKLFTPLSLSDAIQTGQRTVMPCGWEANRRSGGKK